MGIINTSSFSKLLWPGINAIYGKSYAEYPVEYTDLFDSYTSTKAYEEDLGVTGFRLAQEKLQGASVTYDEERQAFLTRYVHAVFALGFIVTREMFDDDQYGVVGARKARGLAFSMRQTKEINHANVYNRAFNSSYMAATVKSFWLPTIRTSRVVLGRTSLLRLRTCPRQRLSRVSLTSRISRLMQDLRLRFARDAWSCPQTCSLRRNAF